MRRSEYILLLLLFYNLIKKLILLSFILLQFLIKWGISLKYYTSLPCLAFSQALNSDRVLASGLLGVFARRFKHDYNNDAVRFGSAHNTTDCCNRDHEIR